MTHGSWTYRRENPCCELAAFNVWSALDLTLSWNGFDREMTTLESSSLFPQNLSSPGPTPSADPWSMPTKSSAEQRPPMAPPSSVMLPSNGAPNMKELGVSVSHLMAQKFSSTRTQAVYRRLDRYRDRPSIRGP